ncbi:hypothetical protein MUN74_10580 [Agromyces endophyticus]|uniref:hypothetical protein n=1 Tax=Agromyces sp. H17E-10 TaxID=2932244 RepID=UPI001FCFA9F8|nr:hypothetical protein [Agromyces sp. H17E-10]UOQ87750.1 hypothetical protein MUN74_10580 [Agromyces sp. H17E-10]
MIELTDIDLDEDGELSAVVMLPGDRHVAVLFALDDDEQLGSAEMLAIAQRALAPLTGDELDRLDDEIVHELVDSDFEGGEREAEASDYAVLADELDLQGAIVSSDATLVLVYEAPTQYAGLVIYAELDEALLIDVLSVAEPDLDDEDEDEDDDDALDADAEEEEEEVEQGD